jgi:hypothetical protein
VYGRFSFYLHGGKYVTKKIPLLPPHSPNCCRNVLNKAFISTANNNHSRGMLLFSILPPLKQDHLKWLLEEKFG